jgi:hypothetical protein
VTTRDTMFSGSRIPREPIRRAYLCIPSPSALTDRSGAAGAYPVERRRPRASALRRRCRTFPVLRERREVLRRHVGQDGRRPAQLREQRRRERRHRRRAAHVRRLLGVTDPAHEAWLGQRDRPRHAERAAPAVIHHVTRGEPSIAPPHAVRRDAVASVVSQAARREAGLHRYGNSRLTGVDHRAARRIG